MSVALLAVTVPASAASPAAVAARRGPAAASAWQASQLTNGRIHNGEFDFDDWGLTIDTAFALANTGNRPAALREATRAIRRNYYDAYVTAFGFSAGAAAKALLVARVLGKNPQSFGNRNVRALVLGTIAPKRAGFERGRLRDRGGDDFSNTIVQAYGVIALARTGQVPQTAVSYLLKQQCGRGFFRLNEEVGRPCGPSGHSPDLDSTALAIQALIAARRSGAAVPRDSVPEAGRWLASVQRRNGSFGGGVSTAGSNTNSTGLAALALVATNRDRAQHAAAEYVARLQLTSKRVAGTPARRDLGAIAYNRAGLTDAVRNGIQLAERDQFRRATAQAIFALRPIPFTTLHAR